MMGFNYNNEVDQRYYDDIATYARNLTWIPAQTASMRLTGAAVYELPVGKGSAVPEPHESGARRRDLGGCVVSSLFTYNSRTPIRLGGAVVNGDPGGVYRKAGQAIQGERA